MKYASPNINLTQKKTTSTIFVGDIHGAFKTFHHNLKQKDIRDAIVFLCGDIGFGFYKPNYYTTEIGDIQDTLQERNIYVIAIRGNHDDPHYFTNDLKNISARLHDEFSNWLFVSDYDLVHTPTHNILCIGGGVSIDRTNRELNKSFWDGELVKPLYARRFLELTKYQIDVVASHNSPSIALPYGCGKLVHD